jgi:hypothetical protein
MNYFTKSERIFLSIIQAVLFIGIIICVCALAKLLALNL